MAISCFDWRSPGRVKLSFHRNEFLFGVTAYDAGNYSLLINLFIGPFRLWLNIGTRWIGE